MRTRCRGGIDHWDQTPTGQFRLRQGHPAQFRHRRQPIATVGHLATYLPFRKMSGPGNDGRQSHPALKQAEFRAAIGSTAAPAKMGTFLHRMAIVGRVNDNCLLPQPGFLH